MQKILIVKDSSGSMRVLAKERIIKQLVYCLERAGRYSDDLPDYCLETVDWGGADPFPESGSQEDKQFPIIFLTDGFIGKSARDELEKVQKNRKIQLKTVLCGSDARNPVKARSEYLSLEILNVLREVLVSCS